MIERAARRDPQRRLDRRLPGRARTWRSIMPARPMSSRFTEALHQEMKGNGVKVSALCPGPTATEFFEVAGAPRARRSPRWRPIRSAWSRPAQGPRPQQRRSSFRGRQQGRRQGTRFMPRASLRRIVARIEDASEPAPKPADRVRPPGSPRLEQARRTASRGRSSPAGASAPSGGRRTSSCRGSRPYLEQLDEPVVAPPSNGFRA